MGGKDKSPISTTNKKRRSLKKKKSEVDISKTADAPRAPKTPGGKENEYEGQFEFTKIKQSLSPRIILEAEQPEKKNRAR